MWLAILLILGIALCIAGLVWGTLWISVPALLLIGGGAIFYLVAIRSSTDEVGHIEKGPTGPSEQPEDTPGGPEHASTGFAHGGQRHMAP